MIKIGILGGGQLGKMLSEAAKQLSFPLEIHIYDASEAACAKDVSDYFYTGAFDDIEKVKAFANQVDIVTYEFENISPLVIEPILHKVPQGIDALIKLSNRTLEKELINTVPGIKTVPYQLVDQNFSMKYPFVVKTVTSGYDGKGQKIIRTVTEEEAFVEQGMVAEKFLPNLKEYSLIYVRSTNGESTYFPPFENHHINHILDSTSIVELPQEILKEMINKAKLIAEELNYYGVLTVEYFYANGELYVNEVAPRVHNSGHITLDAMNHSQFTMHLLSILGKSLPKLKITNDYMMLNVLGQHYNNIKNVNIPGYFYDYGKHSTKKDRKVGHINCPKSEFYTVKEVRDR